MPRNKRPGRGRPMPNCFKLHPLCRALCCRTLDIGLQPHETQYPHDIVDGKKMLQRVTINEHLYPDGEQVCVLWDKDTKKCREKSAGRKAPEGCERFTCLNDSHIWETIQKRLAMQERGEIANYDPEDRLLPSEELKAARNEVNRLNRLRK